MRILMAIILAVAAIVGFFALKARLKSPHAVVATAPSRASSTESTGPAYTPALGATCPDGPGFEAAAAQNLASLQTIIWSPFERAEQGWEIYAPMIAATLNVDCAPGQSGFAAALARWQKAAGLSPTGVVDLPTFQTLKGDWNARRPFLGTFVAGVCPEGPREESLAVASLQESYGGKLAPLRPAALKAYRDMVAAARRELPGLAAQPEMLQIFSAYRSPASDAQRCAEQNNCQGVVRAQCSPHRTGLAIDIVVGQAPGHRVDSSADENRLFMSRTPAYRWLVKNAGRFGFANYVFEPWHWEWTGEPVGP